MYLEKIAVDYLKNVRIDRIFKKYFVSENSNKSVNVRGNSNEFLEHREYQYSDDLKNINWKLFARTSKLYTKVFSTDVSKDVFILLDISKSMVAGRSISKLEYAKYLVGVVAYKLCVEGYKVTFSTFSDTLYQTFSFGIKNFSKFDTFLSQIKPYGKTNFSEVLKRLPAFMNTSSNLLIVSDFVFITSQEVSFIRRCFPKRDIIAFQILSQEEINFVEGSFVELVEPEENIKKLILVSETHKNYIESISTFLERLYIATALNKIPLITFNTSIPYYITLKKSI